MSARGSGIGAQSTPDGTHLVVVADVAGKYYIPKMGAFIVYSLMIAILLWRPNGLFVRQGGKA